MKQLIIAALALLAFPIYGCAQLKPTTYVVDLSWTVPTGGADPCGTGTSACGYVISVAAVPVGTTTCPTPNLTTPNYTPLNAASPATGTSFRDTSSGGQTVCYIAQTVQGSNLASPTGVSQPSNTVGPLVVPGTPTAPTLGTPSTTTAMLKPLIPRNGSQLAALRPVRLRVRFSR